MTYTEDDHALARLIVEKVFDADVPVIRALQIARLVGLPYAANHRERSINRIHRVMPLATTLSRDMYPGRVLIVDTQYEYRIIDAHDDRSFRAVHRRTKQAITKIQRAQDELSIARTPSQLAYQAALAFADPLKNLLAQLNSNIAEEVSEKPPLEPQTQSA